MWCSNFFQGCSTSQIPALIARYAKCCGHLALTLLYRVLLAVRFTLAACQVLALAVVFSFTLFDLCSFIYMPSAMAE